MRSPHLVFPSLLILAFAFINACTSSSDSTAGQGDGPSYDGAADAMESLPDCGEETIGSLFWVKEKNGAFECYKTGWKQRKNAQKPEDVIEEEKSGEQSAITPRILN